MNRENIEQIIRDLFRQNYNAYPDSYPLAENGLMTEEGTINAQEIARTYWDVRNEDEIERDEKAGVTQIDYVEWVMAELSKLIPAALATTEKAANHFLKLYKEDLAEADVQVAKTTIREWWNMTEGQYDGVDYEDVEKEILSKL